MQTPNPFPTSLPCSRLQSQEFGAELVFPCFPWVPALARILQGYQDHAELEIPIGWTGWLWSRNPMKMKKFGREGERGFLLVGKTEKKTLFFII